MNSDIKSSITIALAIALLTGFLPIAFTQKVQAQVPGLDLSGLPGLNFLKGHDSHFLAGIGFGIGAIMKFKQHKDNPTQIHAGKG